MGKAENETETSSVNTRAVLPLKALKEVNKLVPGISVYQDRYAKKYQENQTGPESEFVELQKTCDPVLREKAFLELRNDAFNIKKKSAATLWRFDDALKYWTCSADFTQQSAAELFEIVAKTKDDLGSVKRFALALENTNSWVEQFSKQFQLTKMLQVAAGSQASAATIRTASDQIESGLDNPLDLGDLFVVAGLDGYMYRPPGLFSALKSYSSDMLENIQGHPATLFSHIHGVLHGEHQNRVDVYYQLIALNSLVEAVQEAADLSDDRKDLFGDAFEGLDAEPETEIEKVIVKHDQQSQKRIWLERQFFNHLTVKKIQAELDDKDYLDGNMADNSNQILQERVNLNLPVDKLVLACFN
jgi:hypothetical protein